MSLRTTVFCSFLVTYDRNARYKNWAIPMPTRRTVQIEVNGMVSMTTPRILHGFPQNQYGIVVVVPFFLPKIITTVDPPRHSFHQSSIEESPSIRSKRVCNMPTRRAFFDSTAWSNPTFFFFKFCEVYVQFVVVIGDERAKIEMGRILLQRRNPIAGFFLQCARCCAGVGGPKRESFSLLDKTETLPVFW